MESRLSLKQIGNRVAKLRKQKGLSQQDLARLLAIPRSSVAQIELGNRNITVIELMKISEILQFSIDKFLAKEYPVYEEDLHMVAENSSQYRMRISVPDLNVTKFRNVLLYLLERCAGKPNVGETVLNKLLYFCDFNYYERYEEHLTGAQYYKLPFGPVPQKMDAIIGQMLKDGALKQVKTTYFNFPQTRYLPLEKADLTQMNAAEKDVIDQVIDQFSDWSAAIISEYSHKDMPWKASEEGEAIDYELAFYREAPFSARIYTDEPEQA